MRAGGIADDHAFAVGATLTVPVTGRAAGDVVTAITELGVDTDAMTTRKPTLDDVYLQLTGSSLAA